jgi:hypothetical protein
MLEEVNMNFNASIVIPSFKRESWLYEYFIDNMYEYLLEPLNKAIDGKGKLIIYLYVQNTSDDWKEKLIDKVSSVNFIKIDFVTNKPNTFMTEIRCNALQKMFELDNSITHLMMADDDLAICSNERLIDHFVTLFDSRNFIDQTAVFIAKPSSKFRTTSFQMTGPYVNGHFDNSYLNLIRFQCFPAKYFLMMMKADWNDLSKLYKINNGEDNIILVLNYVAMYSELGTATKFLNVFGYDELLHFSTTMTRIDVPSGKFKKENYELPNDYYDKTEKFVKDILSKYNFTMTGFIKKDQRINSRNVFYENYPGIYNNVGLLDLKPNTLHNFIGNINHIEIEQKNSINYLRHRNSLKSTDVTVKDNNMNHLQRRNRQNENNERYLTHRRINNTNVNVSQSRHVATRYRDNFSINVNTSCFTDTNLTFTKQHHVCAVIPSYKREEWLLKFIPNAHDNLLQPLNSQIGENKLTYKLYVQGCSDENKTKLNDLLKSYGKYISIVYVPHKKDGETISKLRLDFMKDALANDSSITHLMMTDDDTYIKDSHNIIRDFRIFFANVLDDNSVYDIIPHMNDDNNIKVGRYCEALNSTSLMWMMRFQIYSKNAFTDVVYSDWNDIKILEKVEVAEDAIFILLMMISGATYYNVYGFNDFIHIGVEDLFERHGLMNNVTVNDNLSYIENIKKQFNFGNSGYNSGKPHTANSISGNIYNDKRSIKHYYPVLFKDNDKTVSRFAINIDRILDKSFCEKIIKKEINIHSNIPIHSDVTNYNLTKPTISEYISKIERPHITQRILANRHSTYRDLQSKKIVNVAKNIIIVGECDDDWLTKLNAKIRGSNVTVISNDYISNDFISRKVLTEIKNMNPDMLIVNFTDICLSEMVDKEGNIIPISPLINDATNKIFYYGYNEENAFIKSLRNVMLVQNYCKLNSINTIYSCSFLNDFNKYLAVNKAISYIYNNIDVSEMFGSKEDIINNIQG